MQKADKKKKTVEKKKHCFGGCSILRSRFSVIQKFKM